MYARVSTDRQDHERQICELEEFVGKEYPDTSVERFTDIIPGTNDECGVEYHRLREAIADREVDVGVKRLYVCGAYRSGTGPVHGFHGRIGLLWRRRNPLRTGASAVDCPPTV
ncbi:recombinase family protein [Halorubrum sp. CGM4_25_10-8A]|uniref:recombinase family protein n=1 Tax=Halorubrum sp. CGM4_25_10-8A TaxID=2518116 RepID=UPI00130D515E